MDIFGGIIILLCVFALTNGSQNTKVNDRRQLCTDDQSQCIFPGSTEICSGRGDCICGNCQCRARRGDLPVKYTGRWCECDKTSCPSYNGEICGGSDHGVCDCGFCKCYKNYTGRNCGCSTKTDNCKSRDGNICGGHGRCACNTCKCDEGYGGTNCTECKGCDTCEMNKDCVTCMMRAKHNGEGCKHRCTKLRINIVDKVEQENTDETEKLCEYDDIKFILRKDDANSISIKASRIVADSVVADDPDSGAESVSLSLALLIGLQTVIIYL